jgi:hypothetical protein
MHTYIHHPFPYMFKVYPVTPPKKFDTTGRDVAPSDALVGVSEDPRLLHELRQAEPLAKTP